VCRSPAWIFIILLWGLTGWWVSCRPQALSLPQAQQDLPGAAARHGSQAQHHLAASALDGCHCFLFTSNSEDWINIKSRFVVLRATFHTHKISESQKRKPVATLAAARLY